MTLKLLLKIKVNEIRFLNVITEIQPMDKRKNGFGTKDASKTDEFCNAIRMEQYRHQLKTELKLLSRGQAERDAELERMLENRKTSSATTMTSTFSLDNVPLYDIGRTRVTEYDPKSKKDSFYKFKQENDKCLGEAYIQLQIHR